MVKKKMLREAIGDSLARRRSDDKSKSETLIIAEWDDVIFPSTWFLSFLTECHGGKFLEMDMESWTHMWHIAMTAEALLSVACTFGNVRLVCNSKQRMWENYVVWRDNFNFRFSRSAVQMGGRIKSTNFKRVICIGDTPAVRSVLSRYSGSFKTLPTLLLPTPGELISQMQMLMSTVPDTINSMSCLDTIDEEQATVSEAELAASKPNAQREVVALRAKEALGTHTKETYTRDAVSQNRVSRRLLSL